MTSDKNTFSVILLAGDRPTDEISKIAPRNRKALLQIHEKPMILYVLETLVSSEKIDSITIVGNRIQEIETYPEVVSWCSFQDHRERIFFVEGKNSPATSVVATLKTQPMNNPVLVLTADSPLLTVESLNVFCDMAFNLKKVDVAAGLAVEQDIRTSFPGVRRTFIRLAGIGYSGCNLFALLSDKAFKAAEVWCEVEMKRKRPWQLISFFGWTNLFKALMGRLDLESAFLSVSKFMDLDARPIIIRDPAAAMDVDRPEHIPVAEQVLLSRRGVSAPSVY